MTLNNSLTSKSQLPEVEEYVRAMHGHQLSVRVG
jgi:hypothetical protein